MEKTIQCEEQGCEKQANSVVRTKQARQKVGAGPVTTVTWFIDDATEVEKRLGTTLCADHRDQLLVHLGDVL